MTHFGTDNLRLEVEVPTTGLPNLVQNPDGEKGSWAYLTPASNTTVSTDSANGLKFETTVSQAAYFTTELLPVAAGKYIAARFDNTGMPSSTLQLKCRFEFYNSAKVLLSSSAQTANLGITNGTKYVASVQTPVNTAYVKLRWDLYSSTGTNPAAGSYFFFKRVMVTWNDTSAGIGSTRGNLVKNPSFEVNTTGWGPGTGTNSANMERNTSAQSVNAPPYVGSAVLRVQTIDASDGYTRVYYGPTTMALADLPPVSGGSTYTIQAQVRAHSAARSARLSVFWVTSTGASAGSAWAGSAVTDSTTAWTQLKGSVTAPSNAAYMRLGIEFQGTAYAEYHFIDAVMIERSDGLGTYFDGSTAAGGGWTYAWSGTAHNSTSTATASSSSYEFTEPYAWRNILGPTHDIKITRSELNVGLLSATVIDPLLDPSVEDDVRPGKKVRLQGLVDGAWHNVYEGKVTAASVTYVPETRVQISASDAIATLANQGESRGVAAMADLPYLLEGKGVPWNISGSGNQVASATVVSLNESASVLDQIAITRDTNRSKAFVSRDGVLTAGVLYQDLYHAFTDNPTNVATGGDYLPYSNLDLSFSTEECINSVMVKWLRYTAATGETEEIVYGPYQDAASIKDWGAHEATFTIHGATESSANIAAFANAVLSANKTPFVRANSLVFPVRNAQEMKHAVMLDLYDTAGVVFKTYDSGLANLVVTSIEHNISPDKWTVAVGFGSLSAVAAPTWTPTPPATQGDVSNEPKGGTTAITINAVNTRYTKAVTFPTPFATTPAVVTTAEVIGVETAMTSVTNVSTTGFTLNAYRNQGTGSLTVHWVAVA
jgi:hypothetical protein